MFVINGIELASLIHLTLRRLNIQSSVSTHYDSTRTKELHGSSRISKNILCNDHVDGTKRQKIGCAPEIGIDSVAMCSRDVGQILGGIYTYCCLSTFTKFVQLATIVARYLEYSSIDRFCSQPCKIGFQTTTCSTLVQIVTEKIFSVDDVRQLRIMANRTPH